MPRAPHPLLIIGLDGASPTVLDRLADRLPNIQRLRTEGASGIARSTEPPATFPAWTSVLTGCPPEAHGVRDLLTRDTPSSPLRPVSGSERCSPMVPEELARAGYAVACVGVPGLFPPPQAPGFWLSGFDAPGADRANRASVFPPSLHRVIEALGGWRYATFNEQRVDLATAADALLDDLEVKSRIALALQHARRWDLFFVHLQTSDTACHHLWPTWDRASPRARAYEASDDLPRIFERLDALVGELVAQHPGRTVLVSDHGFGGAADLAIHLNRVLHALGFLRFAHATTGERLFEAASRLAATALPSSITGPLTRHAPSWLVGRAIRAARQAAVEGDAFSDELDYAPSIWLRRPLSDREHLALEEALLSLRDPRTGAGLIRAVHRREGAGCGADLYLEPAWLAGYRPCFLPSLGPGAAVRVMEEGELRGGRGRGMPGVHHPDGVIALAGAGVPRRALHVTLPEVGASIPNLMGLPSLRAPGRAAPALAERVGLRDPREVAGATPAPSPKPVVSSAVTKRLEALGYL